MEDDAPSKPSVAELAGRFKGHILPMPTANDAPPRRRRPPCSLKLPNQKDDNEDSQKTISPSSNPVKVRARNSAFIEKLQANLALSPTALLPPPKSPDVKLHPAPLSPLTPSTPGTTPPTPLSPGLRPANQPCEEEEPVGFETPAEGTTLPNFNKTRARLSFKRRPPTRQHRRSAGEEPTSPGTSPCELSQPDQNGLNSDQVFHSPTEEEEPTTTTTTAATAGEQEEATEGESDTIQEEEKICTEEEETEEQSTRREGQEEASSEPSAEEREEKEVKEEEKVEEKEEEKVEEKSQEEEDAEEGM